MSERVLVTGATGFVGAAVARALCAKGHDVRVLVRPNSPRRNLEGLAAEVVMGSLEDAASLDTALAGCTALFHVAADYRLWVPNAKARAAMMAANVEGTRSLMTQALRHKINRVVYTSSVATLGLPHDDIKVADEDTPSTLEGMIGPYKRSKFLAEAVVRDMVTEKGLPAVIVNPSTPIGPGDVRPTPTGRMILDAAKGRIPAYVDTGLNVVHVDDVAQGHLLAWERGKIGRRYILGGENLSLAEILRLVALSVGRKMTAIPLPRAPLMPVAVVMEGIGRLTGAEPMLTCDSLRMAAHHMYFSSDRAQRELGYHHRPAAHAIAEAVAWFRHEGRL